ncbi:hypothetical protein G6M89_21035 [Natronolimnobius sp. AArcel1]|uniref:hypothetical protein n=1 Tax=Natronolimnobius sp. AArcel1 TaxID=1679093 RepID=UPI0013EBF3B1|nr:hypothetical protein [Natronolimnobius sp. AArcel1]NGM71441.1 hypothetical protein [Natronolimnobius sp. AArcel1]
MVETTEATQVSNPRLKSWASSLHFCEATVDEHAVDGPDGHPEQITRRWPAVLPVA